MSIYGKGPESLSDNPAGGQAFKTWLKRDKRNVIATADGWVKRTNYTDQHGNARKKDEILVSGNLTGPASNGQLGFPDIAEVYVSSNSTGGTALTRNTFANVYVVFNEPVFIAGASGRMRITIANTVSGNNTRAFSNTTNGTTSVINANNTVVFKVKLPNSVGTYKIQAQTIANGSATAVNMKSRNTGARNANLVISGIVSNACGTFTTK